MLIKHFFLRKLFHCSVLQNRSSVCLLLSKNINLHEIKQNFKDCYVTKLVTLKKSSVESD